MPARSDEEITAWHEAGHAFVAVLLGGQIDSVSVDPDRDDGPNRFGDTSIRWDTARFSRDQLCENAVLCALAGPVAEMIHCGDAFHPATVAEWSLDWQLAWRASSESVQPDRQMQYLEDLTIRLHRILSGDAHWATIGAIVDHLLAYGSLEGETVHEIVAEWCH